MLNLSGEAGSFFVCLFVFSISISFYVCLFCSVNFILGWGMFSNFSFFYQKKSV